jgi:hypothetical protein
MCYIGETSRPLEVHIKKHKHNLRQGLLEKSRLAQHAYEEDHKICSELSSGMYCCVKQLSETSVDNYFTWQYIPEDNSEHHTRRRENLKSRHKI